MSLKYPYPKSIPEAAQLLDSVRPGWYGLVKVPVDQSGSFNCVLGQVYNNHTIGIHELFYVQLHKVLHDDVFGSTASNVEWQREVDNRKQAAVVVKPHGILSVKTQTRKVERVVVDEKVEKTYTLTLTEDQANDLFALFWSGIGGLNPSRGRTFDVLANALRDSFGHTEPDLERIRSLNLRKII